MRCAGIVVCTYLPIHSSGQTYKNTSILKILKYVALKNTKYVGSLFSFLYSDHLFLPDWTRLKKCLWFLYKVCTAVLASCPFVSHRTLPLLVLVGMAEWYEEHRKENKTKGTKSYLHIHMTIILCIYNILIGPCSLTFSRFCAFLIFTHSRFYRFTSNRWSIFSSSLSRDLFIECYRFHEWPRIAVPGIRHALDVKSQR